MHFFVTFVQHWQARNTHIFERPGLADVPIINNFYLQPPVVFEQVMSVTLSFDFLKPEAEASFLEASVFVGSIR